MSDMKSIDDLRIDIEIEDDYLVVRLGASMYYGDARNITSGYISLDRIAEALAERACAIGVKS